MTPDPLAYSPIGTWAVHGAAGAVVFTGIAMVGSPVKMIAMPLAVIGGTLHVRPASDRIWRASGKLRGRPRIATSLGWGQALLLRRAVKDGEPVAIPGEAEPPLHAYRQPVVEGGAVGLEGGHEAHQESGRHHGADEEQLDGSGRPDRDEEPHLRFHERLPG